MIISIEIAHFDIAGFVFLSLIAVPSRGIQTVANSIKFYQQKLGSIIKFCCLKGCTLNFIVETYSVFCYKSLKFLPFKLSEAKLANWLVCQNLIVVEVVVKLC